MDALWTAQVDFDNWVEILVTVLVVGGAIFGTITKKLIAVFGPKKDGETGEGPARRQSAETSLESRPDIVPTAPPTARPSSPQTGVGPRRSGPPALVEPAVIPVQPASPALQQPRLQSRPHPPVAKPLTPTPTRSEASGGSAAPPPRQKRPRIRAAGRLGHLVPTVHDHLDHLHSDLEDRADDMETVVEQHLDYLDLTVEPVTAGRGAKPGRPEVRRGEAEVAAGPGSLIGRLTPGNLRSVIVLSEIIGPPLALRPPD